MFNMCKQFILSHYVIEAERKNKVSRHQGATKSLQKAKDRHMFYTEPLSESSTAEQLIC